MGNSSQGGKGSKKIGRQSRRPSKKRYNIEERWAINKARRIAKQKKKRGQK